MIKVCRICNGRGYIDTEEPIIEGVKGVIKLDMEKIKLKPSSEMSTEESLKDVIRINWFNENCCKEAVYWNPYNKVVQCHMCGQIFEPKRGE